MNTNLKDVLFGVITNGLISLLFHVLQKGNQFLIGKDLIERIKTKETSLEPILNDAMETVTNELEWIGPSRVEIVCLFLSSPDVEAMIRQIFSIHALEKEDRSDLELIQKEFLHSFALYADQSIDKLRESSDRLFQFIVQICGIKLDTAIDKGILSAHEAKSSLRHRLLQDELASISKNLKLLLKGTTTSLIHILEFEQKYRSQVASRHAYIIPPHFDNSRKLPIDDLYVLPSFIPRITSKQEETALISPSILLSTIYRAVLLGNPGGGKSTFTTKLCHDIATLYEDRLLANRHVTPILVILREYGADKKLNRCSILQHIETMSCTRYQIHPPAGAFEFLLRNGHFAVIFDGLDELLETNYRQEISSDIESFCSLYPAVPVLVTSREVGYEQAPLDTKIFETFKLAPFNDGQVKEYVEKWFSVDLDLSTDQQKQKAEAFFEESEIVPDLRSNPLMLALMCNIYRGENYIPRNRPDVYEKCSLMLFERLDKIKGIYVQFPFEAHISPAIKFIAHWIYQNEKLQSGVTERNLIDKATEYLCPRRFEDRDEAEGAAKDFIAFCKGRAWVFTDTGTTKDGESLFQFSHRTFLEYFTAAHLVRIYPIPERLGEILIPKIIKREWDVVAQLSFQIQNKNVEGAGDDLLNIVLTKASDSTSSSKNNLLLFATRCLEFMIPSPRITRKIATDSLFAVLKNGEYNLDHKLPKVNEEILSGEEFVEEVLNALFNTTIENRQIISDSTEKMITEWINQASDKFSLIAEEIGLHLILPSQHYYSSITSRRHSFDDWYAMVERILQNTTSRLQQMAREHFSVCMTLFWKKKITIDKIIEWHGVDSLFKDRNFILIPSLHRVSIADSLLAYYTWHRKETNEENLYPPTQLKLLGKVFLKIQLPVCKDNEFEPFSMFFVHRFFKRTDQDGFRYNSLEPNVRFAIICILAIVIEYMELRGRTKEILKMIAKPVGVFIEIAQLAEMRMQPTTNEKIITILHSFGFSSEQEDFLLKWIKKESSMIEHPEPQDRLSSTNPGGITGR